MNTVASSQPLPVVRTPLPTKNLLKRCRTKSAGSDFVIPVKQIKTGDNNTTTTNENTGLKTTRLSLYSLQTEMNQLFVKLEASIDTKIKSMTAEFNTSVENLVKTKFSAINSQIESLSSRMEGIESVSEDLAGVSEGVTRDICDLSEQIQALKGDVTYSDTRYKLIKEDVSILEKNCKELKQKVVQEQPTHNIVIKNLQEMRDERIDEEVNELFTTGLGLTGVIVVHAERRVSRNQYPGIVVVSLETQEVKRRILQSKKVLRRTNSYRDVYIEPELKPETRLYEQNMRTLLKATGNDGKLKMYGGVLRPSSYRQTVEYSRPNQTRRHSESWDLDESLINRASAQQAEYRHSLNKGRSWRNSGRRQNSPVQPRRNQVTQETGAKEAPRPTTSRSDPNDIQSHTPVIHSGSTIIDNVEIH